MTTTIIMAMTMMSMMMLVVLSLVVLLPMPAPTTATKPAILANYPDAKLLHDGLDKMQGHLTWPEFMQGREPRRTVAVKVALLAAYLRAGVPFYFAALRYTGSAGQTEALRAATLNGLPLSWIDGVKAVNPEAYYYWHRAIQLGQPGRMIKGEA